MRESRTVSRKVHRGIRYLFESVLIGIFTANFGAGKFAYELADNLSVSFDFFLQFDFKVLA